MAREHAEFEEELKELKKDLATSTGEAKAKVQAADRLGREIAQRNPHASGFPGEEALRRVGP